jgi:NTP pyrophosphatase (non-canonical NTP hydrolase)
MNLHEYQSAITRTCATTDAQDTLKLALVGLFDELGEIAGPLKKYLWQGHPLDIAHLQEEVGDVLWYLATLCNALGIALAEACEVNIEKLRRRYPDGFSAESSRTRSGEHEAMTHTTAEATMCPPEAGDFTLTLSLLRVRLWEATNDALSFSWDAPLSSEAVTQLGVQLGRLMRVLARRHITPLDTTTLPPAKEV